MVRWAWRQLCIGGLARPKLIDRLALDLLDRGSGTASYGWIELRQLRRVSRYAQHPFHFY